MRPGPKAHPGRLLLATLAACTFFAACSDTIQPIVTPAVDKVIVNPKDGVWTGSLKVGDTITFAAKALAADGTELPTENVSWISADTTIATVAATGVVSARRAGSVQITAKIAGKLAHVVVMVVDDPPPAAVVSRVLVYPLTSILEIGETRQFTVRVFDAQNNELFGRAVTWSTTAPENISVSATGMVRALRSGYAEVLATVDGVTSSATVTVATP